MIPSRIGLLDSAEGLGLGQPSYQRVRHAIRSDIARGVLRPGERLKTAELGIRYGLSPAPIREALSQLEAEGWVVILPNRGASVREIDEVLLRELNEVRVALESYNARLCAEVATAQHVATLEAIEAEYEARVARIDGRAHEPEDVAALVGINARLHEAIHAIRPNREAREIVRRQSQFFNAMRTEWGYGSYRPKQIALEHRALLDAFRRRDAEAAERASREHIGHAMEDLLTNWRKGERDKRRSTGGVA